MTNKETIIDPETVDFAATRERMRLINKSALAREIGTSQQAVSRVLMDNWSSRNGVVYQRILGVLELHGLLARKQDVSKAA